MVHDAAATGYQRESGTYGRARPPYHPDIIDAISASIGPGRVLDLGAGTGILTTALVDRGMDVVAVEPVDAMRRALEVAVPEVDVRPGTAESIPIEDASVDAVVVAQAFHWFDHRPALNEVTRVLAPGGQLITLWNVRDEGEAWVAAWTEVVDQFAAGAPRYRDMDWRRAIEADTRFVLVQEVTCANPQPSNPDHTVARALSVSFIARLNSTQQAVVRDQILAIVDGLGDHFDYPYRTEAQIWHLDAN